MRYEVTKVKGTFRFNTTGDGNDFVVAPHNAVQPVVTAHETITMLKKRGHTVRIGKSAKELKT